MYTKQTYGKNDLQEDPRLDGKKDVEKDIMHMEIINWGKIAQDRDGRRRIQLDFTLKMDGIPTETC